MTESPSVWKVYSRGRWCRKQKAPNIETVNLTDEDKGTNIQQQPKAASVNVLEPNTCSIQSICEEFSGPQNQMVAEVLLTNNMDT